MITINFALDDLNIVRPTNLTGRSPNTLGNVIFQIRLTVFRDPDTAISYGVIGVPSESNYYDAISCDILNGVVRIHLFHTRLTLSQIQTNLSYKTIPRRIASD